MNIEFAKEVGYIRYIIRRLWWRFSPPKSIRLHTGVEFLTPPDNFFASDAFVTEGNVDWCSEYILAEFLSTSPEKGDFLDVGAHIGYYSCLVSPYVDKIFAFEPDERNHYNLSNALKQIKSAEIVPKAVSNANGEISFTEGEASSVSHIAFDTETQTANDKKVDAVTLDAFVKINNVRPKAIKMDIEGFEILALEGSTAVMRAFAPVFLIEYNQDDERPNSWQGLHNLLEASNYVLFAVSRKKGKWNSYIYYFKEYSPFELSALSIKMLFLVPLKDKSWFDEFSKNHGQWDDQTLKPQGIRSLFATATR